jgi:hypothetical protein
MGELLGVAIAKMLFGAIAAWIVKKITGIPAIPSYVVGVGIMSVVGGWLLSHDGFHTFIQAWILYLIGGVVALGLMIFGENKACQNRTHPTGWSRWRPATTALVTAPDLMAIGHAFEQ